jgi:hypothetical protein
MKWMALAAYARLRTPFIVHVRHWRLRMDLRIVLPLAASAVITLLLVVAFVQPWTFGKWNLDGGAAAVVCSALADCAPDAGLTVDGIQNWDICDNRVRRYFGVIFGAIGNPAQPGPAPTPFVFPAPPAASPAPAPASNVACTAAPPADKDFAEIGDFLKTVAPPSNAGSRAHFRVLTAVHHDAVLRALASLDMLAQTEIAAETAKLGANGSAHRTLLRDLVLRTTCYRRQIGTLRSLENAWFVGRLTMRAEWRVRACLRSSSTSTREPSST